MEALYTEHGQEIKQQEEDEGEDTSGWNMASSYSPAPPCNTTGPALRRKGGGRKRRGDLWSHFLYIAAEGKTQCVVVMRLSAGQPTLCGVKMGGKNTTNLKRHLRTYHPDISATIPETLTPILKGRRCYAQQDVASHESPHATAPIPSLPSPSSSSSRLKYHPDSAEQQSRENAVALWIGTTGLPARTVEDPDYVSMMETVDGRFTVPHKARINQLVEAFYCGEKQKFKERLARARKITICVGSWTGKKELHHHRHAPSSFLAVSACYFCTELQRAQHILLNLEQMTHPHTAQVIKMCVERCTEAWGITQEQILTVITTSGGHMVAAFTHQEEEEEEEPSSEEEEDGGQFEDVEEQRYGAVMERTPCVVHTLQLVVNGVQKESCVQRLLDRTRALVKRVRTSSLATERLLKLSGLSLLRDSLGSWSSSYLMVTRLLQVKDAVVLLSGDLGWDCCLLPAEWNKLSVLRDLLLPFAEHTKTLQSDTMSLSLVVPALLDLSAHLSDFSFLSSFRDLGALAQRMSQDLQRRSQCFLVTSDPEFLPLAAAACLLDPTVSDILVDSSDQPIRELLGKAEEYVEEASGTREVVDETEKDGIKDEVKEDLHAEPSASKRPRFRFLSAARQSRTVRSFQACVQQELRRYKEALCHGVHEDSGVEFWLAQSSASYPTLKPLALDLLAMPASQAFTERAFAATAGDLTRTRRSHRARRTVLERSAFLKLNQETLS